MPGSVTALSTTAVKGMRLRQVERVELDELGARGDRSFCVIDELKSLTFLRRRFTPKHQKDEGHENGK